MNFYLFSGIFIIIIEIVFGGVFDRFSGKLVYDAWAKELRFKNATELCTIEVKQCTPHEGSRLSGTCNNYKYPSRGSAKGPYIRLLKPDNFEEKYARRNKNEKPLPSARVVRTTLQSTGRLEDKNIFNTAAPHFLNFILRDISLLSNSIKIHKERIDCCKKENLKPQCSPITVPEDDPYLRVTGIKCLNFSRAETFQDVGCLPNILPPEQINFQTPILDLSTIYGVDSNAISEIRDINGTLKLEKRNNRYFPPTIPNGIFPNDKDALMYKFGFPEAGNHDLKTTLMTILFMKEHNRLAAELHKINPCWKDDRLFKIARQINIATASNILMYELLPLLLGYGNMVDYGLISQRVEQITAYDEDVVPLVYAEFEAAAKYFDTLIDGRIKKYDANYTYLGELSLSETLFRSSLLEKANNSEEITRGLFIQHAAKPDDVQDSELSEHYYAKIEKAHDLIASHIERNRDLGIGGYNDYRHFCGMKKAKKFEDFGDVMDYEKIQTLQRLYEHVDDIDLLVGIMTESFVPGGYVGTTLFCVMVKQLQVFRFSDRFWFERGDQMHSFTTQQLHEIRRTNIARVACDNGDGIKYIQPNAMLNIGQGNQPVPCSHIEGLDLTKWKDGSCQRDEKGSFNSLQSEIDKIIKNSKGILGISNNSFMTGAENRGYENKRDYDTQSLIRRTPFYYSAFGKL